MNPMNGHDVEDLQVGMRATFSKTITEADIVLFAAASGDNNAVHINEEFAATTRFGGRIAHGFLTLATVCRVGDTVVIDGEALVMTTSSAKRQAPAAAVPAAAPAP